MAFRRLLAFIFVLAFLSSMLPILATTTTAGEGGTATTVPGGATATTVAGGATATTVAGGATATTGAGATTTAELIVPAVTVEVTQPVEAQPDWTYRYFIPTLLVLAVLVVVMTVVQYFVRVVRNRYRVVR
jgi:hypothetical protein